MFYTFTNKKETSLSLGSHIHLAQRTPIIGKSQRLQHPENTSTLSQLHIGI